MFLLIATEATTPEQAPQNPQTATESSNDFGVFSVPLITFSPGSTTIRPHANNFAQFELPRRLSESTPHAEQGRRRSSAFSISTEHERQMSEEFAQLISSEETRTLNVRTHDVPFLQSPVSEVSSITQTPCNEQKPYCENPLLKKARVLPKSQSPALQKEALESEKKDSSNDEEPPPLPHKETRRNALQPNPEEPS